jgi:predicted NUDIX family NTP pyrophosphohydrolase
MKISCGVIITDLQNIIGCLPFFKEDEKGNYDIPKGCLNEGEDPLHCAIRELKEETGLNLEEIEGEFTDLGEMDYIKGKNLHLYLAFTPNLPDISTLHCDSTFTDEKTKMEHPEIQRYRYIPVDELDWFFPNLASCISTSTNL